jgi:hypothetical protein
MTHHHLDLGGGLLNCDNLESMSSSTELMDFAIAADLLKTRFVRWKRIRSQATDVVVAAGHVTDAGQWSLKCNGNLLAAPLQHLLLDLVAGCNCGVGRQPKACEL